MKLEKTNVTLQGGGNDMGFDFLNGKPDVGDIIHMAGSPWPFDGDVIVTKIEGDTVFVENYHA